MDKKYVDLISQSMMAQMLSKPWEVRDNLSMKSIIIHSHFYLRIGSC